MKQQQVRDTKINRRTDKTDIELGDALRKVLLDEPEFVYTCDKVLVDNDNVDFNYFFLQVETLTNRIHSILSIKIPIYDTIEQIKRDATYFDNLLKETKKIPQNNISINNLELATKKIEENYPQNVLFERATIMRMANQNHNAEIAFVHVSAIRLHDFQQKAIRANEGVIKNTILVKMSVKEQANMIEQMLKIKEKIITTPEAIKI